MVKKRKSRFNFLVYILLFLSVTSIPASFGTFIPVVISLLFLVLNFDSVYKTLKFSTIEKTFFFVLLLSFFVTIFSNFDSLSAYGILNRFNGWLSFVLYYLTFKLYFKKDLNDDYSKDKFSLNVVRFFTFIVIPFGILELLYIYIYKSEGLHSFLTVINPFSKTYLSANRVNLLDNEPSFLSFDLFMVLIPCCAWLLRRKKHKMITIYSIVVTFLLSLTSFSARFLLDSIVFVLILLLFYNARFINYIRRHSQVFVLLIAFIVICIVFISVNGKMMSYVFNRIMSFGSDYSGMVRIELIKSSLLGFNDSPFVGYGTGGYYLALQEHYSGLNLYNAHMEIMNNISRPSTTTYSFYFTSLCENGVLGILLVIIVVMYLCKGRYYTFGNVMVVYLLFSFMQMEFYGSIKLALALVLLKNMYVKPIKKHVRCYSEELVLC